MILTVCINISINGGNHVVIDCFFYNTEHTATYDGASLLVGFTTGQIQMVVPGRREQGKLYNEEVSLIE